MVKHVGVICLSIFLIVATLPVVTATDPGGPSESCVETLDSSRDTLRDNQKIWSFETAIAFVDETAGAQCGFNIRLGVFPDTPDDLVSYLNSTIPAPRTAVSQEVEGTSLVQNGAEWVKCSVPGGGAGKVEGFVLGFIFASDTAVGAWEPITPGTVSVSGRSEILGGTQEGQVGTIFVGPAPVPAGGSTEGWCIETEETVGAEGSCIFLVVYTHCWAEVKTRVKLTPCAAAATQYFLVPSLVGVLHSYTAEVPCA